MTLVCDLIEKNLRNYSAEYSIEGIGGVSNHLPMCLISLDRVGASDVHLQQFYDWYTPRLRNRTLDETATVSAENLTMQLGNHQNNHSLYLFFNKELARLGSDGLIEEYVLKLMPGVAAGAFHPLIRLAYALEINHEGEICEALASWVMGYLPLVDPSQLDTAEVGPAIEAFSKDRLDPNQFKDSSIFKRVRNVGGSRDFLDRLRRPASLTCGDIADLAIKIYLTKPTFATLHLVTATHALRVICERFADPTKLIDHFWVAFCATYVSEGAPEIQSPDTVKLLGWEDLKQKAVNSQDDHACKFVYSCLEEEKAYGGSEYQMAATIRCTN